jgi:tyrosyl-tRNA synthetase
MNERFARLVDEQISRGVDTLVPREELIAKLAKSERTGAPLRIKLGIDPSAPHLTLGHSVPLRKMRQFQDLGHTGVLIVGDFTRRIGDPSGRASTRALMSEADIKRNIETYQDQAYKILDPGKTEVRYNSEWLSVMRLEDIINLTAKYTVARMLERDDFSKRYAEGRSISVLEFLYPLTQAYDSVAIKADVELGGADQLFNLLVGRDIQREYGQESQVVLTVPLLLGIDGERAMSQTTGNYVGLNEPASEMYGKVLSIPDALIESYFIFLTDVRPQELAGLSPRDAKRLLARTLVSMYHSEEDAAIAEAEFDRIHIHHERPTDVPQVSVDRALLREDGRVWVIDLVQASGLVDSRSQAKRLIEQGGVKVNEDKVTSPDIDFPFDPPMLLQVGKRSFAELI